MTPSAVRTPVAGRACLATINRQAASELMIQTFFEGRHELRKTLTGLADFLCDMRCRSRDLDTTLILMTICAGVMSSQSLPKMQRLETLMTSEPTSDLWTDEHTLAAVSGLSPTAVRRKVEKLVLEGVLLRREDQFTVHPHALGDPRLGLDRILRLARAFR